MENLNKTSSSFNDSKKRAWDILTEEEKASLVIQLGHNKSTWQVGEIISRSHYKYIEIHQRAKNFFRSFSEYFEIYGDELIPPHLDISESLKIYLENTILHRKSIKKASLLTNNKGYRNESSRNKLIYSEFKEIEYTDDAHIINFCNLIIEFDKWNNYRILPEQMREPSGFKRRRNNYHKQNLNKISKLSKASLHFLELELYQEGGGNHYVPLLYLDVNEYSIYNLTVEDSLKEELTNLGIPIFNSRELAKKYSIEAINYLSSEKTRQNGLKFWPVYREIINKSLNIRQMEGKFGTRAKAINIYNSLED